MRQRGFAGRAFGERVERPRALHGGGVQQRAAGHRGEHPAGSGLLQQGEVGLSWQPGRMGSLAAPNCP